MKKILAVLAVALAIATTTFAGPGLYNKTVSVTQTATTVTPTASLGKATFVRVLNDSNASAIFVDFDRPAVAESVTAVRINPCEGRDFVLDAAGTAYLSIIAASGETATARVQTHYMKGVYPTGLPSQSERIPYIQNSGCTAATAIAVTDAELSALAGLTSAASKGIQFTGSGTAGTYDLTTAAKTVLDDASVSAMRTTLGVATGVDATVSLTEAGGAELVASFTSVAGETFGVTLDYRVTVTDGTDFSVRQGSFQLVCANKATAVTCTKDATDQTDDASIILATNSNTLTYAIAADVATANVAKITFNIDSDMTSTGASIIYKARVVGPATVS